MKLIYIQKKPVHRFDVIDDFTSNDIDVLKNSLITFFNQLSGSGIQYPSVVIDLTEATIKVSEIKLQVFITEVKTLALASKIMLIIAQSDIESIHAEQKVIEMSQKAQIDLLQNRLNLVESVKNSIQKLSHENEELRKKMKRRPARHFFEKLWG